MFERRIQEPWKTVREGSKSALREKGKSLEQNENTTEESSGTKTASRGNQFKRNR